MKITEQQHKAAGEIIIQDKAVAIMKHYDLGYEEMACSCAMATAFIIEQCKNNVSVESGFNTAVYGFIEGTKTMPPDMMRLSRSALAKSRH